MTLREALDRLFSLVAEEAERNPQFRSRVHQALLSLSDGDSTPDLKRRKKPSNRRAPPALDPVSTVSEGEAFLRERLAGLSIEQLKDIVANFGMDPRKLVMKWQRADRIVDHIVEFSLLRARKGNAFRTQDKPEE